MSLTLPEGKIGSGATPIVAVAAALALVVSTSLGKGLGPPLQGGNTPVCMVLKFRPVALHSTRPALHNGERNDSARDKVVQKFGSDTVCFCDP
jgi:hypothetical protein